MRDIKLEARIARLEKLLTIKVGKSVKNESNESALSDEMYDQLEDIFDNRFCAGGYSGSHKNWKRDMEDLSNGECPKLVDDAIKWLVNDYHYNREELEYLRDDIASYLADMAADMIYDYDDWDEDEGYDDDDSDADDSDGDEDEDDGDEDDDIEEWDGTVPDVIKDMWAGTKWESRSCRRRASKQSIRELRRSTKNESALPNGMTPRTVGDVLSYYVAAKEGVDLADVSKNKAYVIDYLRDNGDLARIKNSSENRRFFSSVDDVEDAVWGCWDDNLNAWNDLQMKAKTGLAKLFGPDPSSGIFRLTVYPINGRGGRNRTLEIVLTWPMY